MKNTILCFIATLLLWQPAISTAGIVVPVKMETAANAALDEFKHLSKAEKKERLREVKKVLKKYRTNRKSGQLDADENTILLAILAILLPPLAVFLHQGEINTKFWISLVLTLLGWLPGVIYSLIVILDVA